MQRLVIHPTQTAQWHSLVCEAESAANFFLDEELQSYLVFLLMRFLDKPEIAARILAREYLESLLTSGQKQYDKLRDVGDVCLLHAGFFPHRARRKRVSESYFTELGSGAYEQLGIILEHEFSSLYLKLSQSFESLRDLLKTMQRLGEKQRENDNPALFVQAQIDNLQAKNEWRSGIPPLRRRH